MNIYHILLKSYTDAPDFENTVMAQSKKEAVSHFHKLLGKYGWDEETIKRYTEISF